VIIEINFKSGEKGVNYREFALKAYHMDPAPDTIAPLLIHLTDMLADLHPGDILEIVPKHVPELAGARVSSRDDSVTSGYRR
jgi:hypothetical protein